MEQKTKPTDLLYFLNISKISAENLYQWVKGSLGSLKYNLEIMAIKATLNLASPEEFYQKTHRAIKICYIIRKDLVFIIGAKEKAQYQLLEAILEETFILFFDLYGDLISGFLSEFADTFIGFNEIFDNILSSIRQRITYVRAQCKICDSNLNVCIRNSMIENAKSNLVNLVYYHEGHGLLLYIDPNFKVRGAEIVKISA